MHNIPTRIVLEIKVSKINLEKQSAEVMESHAYGVMCKDATATSYFTLTSLSLIF